MSDETTIYSNGILAENGDYGVTIAVDDLYQLILAERGVLDKDERAFLAAQTQGRQAKTLGPPPSITPDNLSEARWGIIWPPNPLTVKEIAHQTALTKLIAYRNQQMGKKPHEFHYRSGWTYEDFLWEEGREVEPGNMETEVVPYYLCIVGSPERIPWDFQNYLDGEYAVGRLWFDDPKDCKSYVQYLLEYENPENPPPNDREVLFLGTQHNNDRPTQQSATQLVKPLYDWLLQNDELQFNGSLLLNGQANNEAYKTHLIKRLKGFDLDDKPKPLPSILFTAGHGLEFSEPSGMQYASQGGLIFQEWPGGFAIPTPSHYLTGDEITDGMDLSGMVAFCFACYSAGTPLKQDWVRPTWFRKPVQIAPAPFVARLPQKLLARGLVAFIGHVSRAWDFSFLGTKDASKQIGPFRETMGQLLRGQPVGHATDYLNARWTHLTVLLDKMISNKKKFSKGEIVATWKARNDCRGYVIIGDPASRIRVKSLKL